LGDKITGFILLLDVFKEILKFPDRFTSISCIDT